MKHFGHEASLLHNKEKVRVKLVSYKTARDFRAGVVVDGRIFDVRELLKHPEPIVDVQALFGLGEAALNTLRARLAAPGIEGLSPSEHRLGPPVLRPPTIRDFMAYEGHATMGGQWEMPAAYYRLPVFYFSNPLCLYGHEEAVPMPSATEKLDYELEIAAVICREGSDIPASEALSYIGTDAIGRVLAKAITAQTGQPVVIENKVGADGIIGVQTVQKAEPDGYTVLLSSSSTQVLNPYLIKAATYDPIRDFTPVTTVARTGMLMNVNAGSPYHSVQEFADAAKRNPDQLSFGSGSTTTRLAGEFFQQQAGIDLLHVPYKTPAQALTDLIGGQLDLVFVDLPASGPHVRAGRLRALAVSGGKRMPAMPELPTLQELGYQDFDLTAWYGFWMPAGAPEPIVNRLSEIVRKVVETDEVQALFANAAMDSFTMRPDEMLSFHQQEMEKIGNVAKAANLVAN
ncbi:MAG: tripartite tricarboxylate transporter substrate-binding protein [Pigmentiphaga sp.]